MKFKKIGIAAGAAAVLLAAGTASGTLAYMSDSEKAVNVFTEGNVAIEALEPTYPGNDSNDVKNLVPNKEVSKDPMVINTGVTDAIVFVTVDSPIEMATVMSNTGTVESAKAPTELFWFKDASDAKATHANKFDSNWQELTGVEKYILIDNTTSPATETEVAASSLQSTLATIHPTSGTRQNKELVKRYVFGYKTKVQGSDTTDGSSQTKGSGTDEASGTINDRTTKLFDKVQMKNVLENEVDGTTQSVIVRTYAIQASEILDGDGNDITTNLTTDNLTNIYKTFVRQNSTDHSDSGLTITDIRNIDDISTTADGASGTTTSHVNRWNTNDDVSGGTEHPNVKP
jgi:predicted ribosomally synthesized peptide with SipW-like signal peptide